VRSSRELSLGTKEWNTAGSTFKNAFLRAQEFSIPQTKKSGRGGREPAWLSKDLLGRLRKKKEAVEAGIGGQGGTEGCCLDVGGWHREGQGADGIEFLEVRYE